jgi:DNA adenine methylase
VVVLCDDALKIIKREDGEKTLFYLDPPYVHNTRASTDAYQHEMDESQHSALLEAIKKCKGSVMLSGYPNGLYDKALGGWNRHDREIDNKVSGAKEKREMTECLWCNF